MSGHLLVIGASGRVGSKLVEELDRAGARHSVRLASSNPETVRQWQDQGRHATELNLDDPDTFPSALAGIDGLFLLTGYTSNMLHQSKTLVDSAVQAGVRHIVHLGVFTSRNDKIPHFVWHDLIERYIESSGTSWTHIHPNVITDAIIDRDPSIRATNEFSVSWGHAKQGWVFAEDIAAVSARVLIDGPAKHHGKDYWLSTEVLTGPEVADILSAASNKQITCRTLGSESVQAYIDSVQGIAVKAYMESAAITMQLAESGQMVAQTVVHDDVMTVLGRPGLSMREWAERNLTGENSQSRVNEG